MTAQSFITCGMKNIFENIQNWFDYTGNVEELLTKECIAYHTQSNLHIVEIVKEAINYNTFDNVKSHIITNLLAQNNENDVLVILNRFYKKIEFHIKQLDIQIKIEKNETHDFEKRPLTPPPTSQRAGIINIHAYEKKYDNRSDVMLKEKIARFEKDRENNIIGFKKEKIVFEYFFSMIEDTKTYLTTAPPNTTDKTQVINEPKADGQKEYECFADLLVDATHLDKIKAVLNEKELLKSDGSISVGTAVNSSKKHITALYYAMVKNSLLKNDSKDIFIDLLQKDFNVSVTSRTLSNPPTRNDDFYSYFSNNFPKVQR